jgi:hypothetical protein
LRALRVAAETVQLALPDPALTDSLDRWWDLPDATRAQVLSLLAGLIARGVLVEPLVDPLVEPPVEPENSAGEGDG